MGWLKDFLFSGPDHSTIVERTADNIHQSEHSTTIYTDQTDYEPTYAEGSVRGVVSEIDRTDHRPDIIVDTAHAQPFVIEVKTPSDLQSGSERAVNQLNAFDESPRHSVALVLPDGEMSVGKEFAGKYSTKLPSFTLTTPSKITDRM